MLHKAEEWNLISRVPKFNLLREYGRRLRLDDDARINGGSAGGHQAAVPAPDAIFIPGE
jgi:hypothetical protein